MEKSQEQLGSFIQEKSATLVFVIAGRIGSGASFVTKALMEELKAFGYKPVEIKITKWLEQDYCDLANVEQNDYCLIRNILGDISSENKSEDEKISNKAQRIKNLQDLGNKLRKKYKKNDILAAISIYYIAHLEKKKRKIDMLT